MLKIFNTLTRKKEVFKPINSNKIKIYVCGNTVYDLCHLGHARTFVVFDTIIRYLKYCGYQVDYTRNITDIDDKIIYRSFKNNESINQLTNRMIKNMFFDLNALNILHPNYEPKVTDHIDTIINFIDLLMKKKYAYLTSCGDIFFSIKNYSNYGILSNRKVFENFFIKKIQNNNTNKAHYADFVLWKSSKNTEPYWVSPWGKGRPGWHIECSAMIHAILGKKIDIHGGGLDLIFPHHENELAQSVCAYDLDPYSYVNIWMHVGILSINNVKMSKSLNNFFTIREILKKYDPETIRYFLLSAHYRNHLQYTDTNLKNARASLEHLYIALRGINPVMMTCNSKEKKFISRYVDVMNDDFNIPQAYAILFEMAHELNILKIKHTVRAQNLAANLIYLANILGFLYLNPDDYLQYKSCDTSYYSNNKIIQKLIQIRENARKNKRWELADKIRIKLNKMGVILEDEYTGHTVWRYRSIK